jgi:23S rRNA C2498 (ribose-2'-O)-methylase RlmM
LKIEKQKYGGRQKNTPNKLTSELRNLVKVIVSNQLENVESDLKKIKPHQRIELIIKLMNFIIPKQNSITGIEGEKIEFIITKGKTIL